MANIPLLSSPFRPFFLLLGVFAVFHMLGWILVILGVWQLPVNYPNFLWHGHEILFGMVPAAIAGFVLTAMCNWTGAKPIRPYPLLALTVLWLAGRLAMASVGVLSDWMTGIIEVAFLPVLTGYVAGVLIRHNNRRNYFLILVLSVFALLNGLHHWGIIQDNILLTRQVQHLALGLITVLIAVIGGRIIPLFTANWLKRTGGDASKVGGVLWLDRAAIGSIVLLLFTDMFPALPWLTGTVAIVAAVLNAMRLANWGGWLTLKEPLLWILHLAYGWLVLALALKGIAQLTAELPATFWIHCLGAGAIATMIIGVITRVALGHTGRPLTLPRYGVLIYLTISAAAILRIVVAVGWMPVTAGLALSAMGWMVGFGVFLWLYTPIFLKPRIDGR